MTAPAVPARDTRNELPGGETMTELNIPIEAIATGWHEFRYPRPAIDEPSAAFKRGLVSAAPLIAAATLEQLADKIWQEHGADNETDADYVTGVDDAVVMMRAEVRRLRGEQS